jgi:hypothetical protein
MMAVQHLQQPAGRAVTQSLVGRAAIAGGLTSGSDRLRLVFDLHSLIALQ